MHKFSIHLDPSSPPNYTICNRSPALLRSNPIAHYTPPTRGTRVPNPLKKPSHRQRTPTHRQHVRMLICYLAKSLQIPAKHPPMFKKIKNTLNPPPFSGSGPPFWPKTPKTGSRTPFPRCFRVFLPFSQKKTTQCGFFFFYSTSLAVGKQIVETMVVPRASSTTFRQNVISGVLGSIPGSQMYTKEEWEVCFCQIRVVGRKLNTARRKTCAAPSSKRETGEKSRKNHQISMSFYGIFWRWEPFLCSSNRPLFFMGG